ncbi:hypothetical protein BD414DRAFT_496942 [Trametes punicea]|nr:hypothetical protein BD414DRAFT_496942 [Trametes punicea]
MSQSTKRKRVRKVPKEKASSSRQTSLLDAFGIKSSSKGTTPTASAATSENESTGPNDIIEICSSDVEPMTEDNSDVGPVSSSPHFTDGDEDPKSTQKSVPGESNDVPIIIVDSSPSTSPVARSKPLPREPPKALYSIFAPRKRPEDRQSSQKPSARAPPVPSAPFPDATMQHVRGPQTTFHSPDLSLSSLPRRPRDATSRNQSDTLENHGHCPFRLRSPRDHPDDAVDLPSPTSRLLDVTNREECFASIPVEHRRYPAIRRFVVEQSTDDHQPSDSSVSPRSLWTDKWRPRRADQVLGNEQAALYLRDWLLALRLYIAKAGDVPSPSPAISGRKGKRKATRLPTAKARASRGTKRPRIVREVQKKRRRIDSEEPEEAWIADDSTDDEVSADVVWEFEEAFLPRKLSRLKRVHTYESLSEAPSSPSTPPEDPLPTLPPDITPAYSYNPPKFGDAVYNTILLCGPNGCGKTAAVYACAEELGWDVFEVYPGIGERSGAALNKFIGDVGKNHLVRQTQHQLRTVLPENPVQPKGVARLVGRDDEADEGSSQEPPIGQEPVRGAPPLNQSIVFVEEVDILYKEDVNFWPTLVKIIKECRRPVVLTCNDVSSVPLEGLPLQTVLHFQPCPIPLAASYLQALCLLEGRMVERSEVERLYARHSDLIGERQADSAVHPRSIPQPPPDLRRTINQLQLGQTVAKAQEAALLPALAQDSKLSEALIHIAKCISLNSFVDCRLRRPGTAVVRDLLANSPSPCADDQLGFKHLVAEPQDMDSDLPVTFSTYYCDQDIVDELLSFSGQHYPVPQDLNESNPDPHPLHAEHCRTLLPALDGLHVPRDQLVRDASSIFVDYEPWARYMSRIDDIREFDNIASGNLEGTRQTRNSQRAQCSYARWITLGDQALDALRRTAFDQDRS